MAIYIIIAVILVVVTGFFFAFPSPGKTLHKRTFPFTDRTTEPQEPENHYYDLRRMALKITPDLVGAENTGRATRVFGIVMDWHTGEGTVTVTAYQNGDASMYVSSGGGIMGGAHYRKVRKAVRSFVDLGQDYIGKAEKTTTTLLPDRHNVAFYLLTNKGTFYAQEEMKAIEYGNSDWRPLFQEANKVLERLRQISEKKS